MTGMEIRPHLPKPQRIGIWRLPARLGFSADRHEGEHYCSTSSQV